MLDSLDLRHALMRRLVLAAAASAALGFAGCVRFVPRANSPAVRPAPLDPSETIAGLVDAHNRRREKARLGPLEPSEPLRLAAQAHADDMAAHRRMSHRGSDGSSPFRRMGKVGYEYEAAAENVAYGQRTVDEVMTAWMASLGHRRNILGNYTEIGAAYATDETGTPYWCVTFGRPTGR